MTNPREDLKEILEEMVRDGDLRIDIDHLGQVTLVCNGERPHEYVQGGPTVQDIVARGSDWERS